jgi:nucleoid DNA-binding protein
VAAVKDLIKKLAEQTGLSQAQVRDLLDKFLDGITDTLLLQGEIRLGKFGGFEVRMRRARTARNPRTGEKLQIPPRAVVAFKPGLEVRERVGQLQQRPQDKPKEPPTADAKPKEPPTTDAKPGGAND